MSNIVIPKSNAQDRASQEFANDILSCKDFKSKGCVVKIHGLGKTLMEDCLSYHFEYNNGEYKTESKPIDLKTYVEVINAMSLEKVGTPYPYCQKITRI